MWKRAIKRLSTNMYKRILVIAIAVGLLYLALAVFTGYKELYHPEKALTSLSVRPKRVVASLTTLPSRLDKVSIAINSIASGYEKPDVIYLHVPAYSLREEAVYPEAALAHIQNEHRTKHPEVKLIINVIAKDYGPGTKLFPVLELERDLETVIFCIDDDRKYDKNTLRHLLEASHCYPSSVITVSGWNYIRIGNLVAIPLLFTVSLMVKSVKILQCYNGVVYKRKMFEADFEKWITCPECRTTDDISISRYLTEQRGIEILQIQGGLKQKDIEFASKKTLGATNLLGNRWIKCIAARMN